MINIQQDIPLAPFTSFKVGGPAKFFAEVGTEEEIMEAFKYAKDNNLEVFVLGGGSNILVSDEGFNGLVIKLQVTSYELRGTNMECGAGILLSEIVKLATQNSLTGLEWAAGIPGTIGGAVRGNAGAFGGEMASSIESVRVLEVSKLQITNYQLSDCQFSYRNSIFKENKNLIVLSANLKLEKGDKGEIEAKVKEIIKSRAEKQPQGVGSAGSFFKNPEVKDAELIKKYEKDTGNKCADGKIPAGWLIAEAGLLGKKIGQFQVSEKHANFVVNLGGGTAQEAIMLVSVIKQQVRDTFSGVELNEEIQYVGF